jgi:hypothetical protein
MRTYVIAAALLFASFANAAEPAPPVATYWHDWTDGKGVSHLTNCKLDKFTLEAMAPPADPVWINKQEPGPATVLTIVQPPGWKGIWHKETKVLWVVTLKGKWFIESMDGTRVELGSGDVFVAEDWETKPDAEGRVGHRSGNIGDDPVTLMVVMLETPPTVDQACRFK